MKFKSLLLVAIMALFSCEQEEWNEIEYIKQNQLPYPTMEVKGDTAIVNGILGETFYNIFVKTIKENPQLKALVLVDIPGSINDDFNVQTCQLVYKHGLTTKLLAHSYVASGGTDLFVSGKKLIITDGAKIGVHSWGGTDKPATEYPRDHPEHKSFIEMYNAVNVDLEFYWYTLQAADADNIHLMTKEEIQKYLGNKLSPMEL